jgi:putative transposase
VVAAPDSYAWSSDRMRMGQLAEDWLDRDPCYLDLGTSEAARQTRYAQFVQEAIPAGEWELIQEALQRGQLAGGTRFVDDVERIIGRRIENRRPGRPKESA